MTKSPQPDPKPRTQSDGVTAGKVYQRLKALDEDEAVELARSPEDIRRKFSEKKRKILEGLTAEVRELVTRMVAT